MNKNPGFFIAGIFVILLVSLNAMEKYIEEYLALRAEIDGHCSRLWQIHKNQMQCKSGCSMCCQSFRILPVEYYVIQNLLISAEIPSFVSRGKDKKKCRFLINDACTIYENRPLMCRTHGFPLVRINEEADAYEVSFCELNFKGFNLNKFTEKNVFEEDKMNSQLFLLNKRFVDEIFPEKYEPVELIELNELK
jgi:Fe-S-cluster containining protein